MARDTSNWMPFYWGKYWQDTGHFRGAAHGAYMNLIGAYWVRGKALPDNDAALEALSKCSTKEWRAVREQVLAMFDHGGGVYAHKRIEAELSKAAAKYLAKARAGEKGSQKRWQKNSTAIAEPSQHASQTDAPLQLHSPIGEKPSANADGKRTRKRHTRISQDWLPTEKDILHATNRGIDRSRIAAIAEHFRDFHIAKQDTSADWSASWRTWVANENRFSAGRAGGGGPKGHGSSRGSVLDALSQNLAALSGENLQRDGGIYRGTDPIRDHETYPPGGLSDSDFNAGTVIDSIEFRGIAEAFNEASDVHDTAAGDDGRNPVELGAVRGRTPGVPAGRGPSRAHDAAENIEVLASMGRVVGAAGPAQQEAQDDAESLAIPAFLKRTG